MSKKIFYSFLILIILLLIFNVRLSYLYVQLDNACNENYSNYILNDTDRYCPCLYNKPERGILNISDIRNINVSIDK